MSSIDYYDENADDFFRRTVDAAPHDQQRRFASMLPKGGCVLDAGCGSGRDARLFRQQGFAVTATEAAPKLAALASEHAGIAVQVLTFDEMRWAEAFDGIWACGSLLHVPRASLPDVLRQLRQALVPGGVWFMSFKYGTGERDFHGCHFTDLDEEGACALLGEAGGLELTSLAVTADVRPGRTHERWLNIYCRRN